MIEEILAIIIFSLPVFLIANIVLLVKSNNLNTRLLAKFDELPRVTLDFIAKESKKKLRVHNPTEQDIKDVYERLHGDDK